MRISDWSSDVCSSDLLRQLALLLAGNGRDARRNDFAALGDEALKQANVLVINAGRILAGEGAALAPTEKWAGHIQKPPLSRDFVAFATRAAITTITTVSQITEVSAITTVSAAFTIAIALAQPEWKSTSMEP